MMRKTLAWIAAATAAVLIGLPGVAQATIVWNPASCATGSIDPVTLDELGHYRLPAHMSQCGGYQSGFTFSVAWFEGQYIPLITGNKLVSYATPNFIIDVYPLLPTPVFGLCLMLDVDTRVSCVRVDTAADGTATSTPIALNDPLVAEQVLFASKPPPINYQYCATCVTFHW